MDEIMYNILPYFTVENGIKLGIGLVVLVIGIFLMKQILKIVALVIVLGVAYYYFLASPEFKLKVNTCVVKSIDSKAIDKSCNGII